MSTSIKQISALLILCLILITIWFHKGLIFGGGEGGIQFYDLNKSYQLTSFVWRDGGTGFPNAGETSSMPYFWLLKNIYEYGVPSYLVQALHFFTLMIVGAISCYFLLRITIVEEFNRRKILFGYQYIPLIGAIFYILNPFSMTQIFGRSLYMQYFAFALFPFFLTLFILGLKKRNFIYGFLALIGSIPLGGAFGNIGYVASLWFLVFLYTIFYISLHRKNIKVVGFAIFFFIVMLVGWVLVNAYWIYPFVKLSSQQFGSALDATEYNLGSLRGVSRQYPLSILIRLLHKSYFFEGMYGSSHSNIFFQTISWLIPVVVLFSISTFKKITHFKFYAAMFFIALFITLGSNFPSGWLFELIFRTVPQFQVFRNPYEKFGLVLLLAYVPFFAIGTLKFGEKIANTFKKESLRYLTPLLIIFLISGIYVWPLWTGIFAGGYKINNWIKVPDYYKEADEWLNSQGGYFRTLHFPLNSGEGLRHKWEHPYQGIELGEYIFSKPAIGRNMGLNKPYYNILLERVNRLGKGAQGPDPDLTNSQFRGDKLFEELAKLNVRFVVLHKDIDENLGNFGSWQEAEYYLSKRENIRRVETFGELDIYAVDIPQNVDLIYSPNTETSFIKKDPTNYVVNIKKAPKEVNLRFLTLFDSNWEAFVDNQKIEDHSLLFSYGNLWKIKREGSYSVEIKYKPQKFLEEGIDFSKKAVLIFSATVVLYIAYSFVSTRRNSSLNSI